MRLVNNSFARLGAAIFSSNRITVGQIDSTRYSREPIAAGRRVDEFGGPSSADDDTSDSTILRNVRYEIETTQWNRFGRSAYEHVHYVQTALFLNF